MPELQKLNTQVSYNLILLYNKEISLVLWEGNWVDASHYKCVDSILPEHGDDLLYVLIVGYKYQNDFSKVITKIKELTPKKIVFINDDYHTFPNHSNKSHESRIIEDIIEKTKINYIVYDPEFNAKIFYNLPSEKIKYFNYYNASWANNLSYKNSLFCFNENRKYKLCNLNRRGYSIRTTSALMTFDMKDVFTTCYHSEIISRLYLKLQGYSKKNTESLLNKIDEFKKTDLRWDHPDEMFSHNKQNDSITIVKDSYVSLTNESKWSGLPFYSEKTMKCYATFTPFILLSSPHTLKLLKDLGYKSFNNWWDESYDTIEEDNKRFDAVMKIVNDLHGLSFDELKQMLLDMRPILEHNNKHLFSKGLVL